MADYVKLYGPALGNLVVTIGLYFHLKSKISEVRPEVNLDEIHEQLGHIDKALKDIITALKRHDQLLGILAKKGYFEGEIQIPNQGQPEEDQRDPRSTKKGPPPKQTPAKKQPPKSTKAKAKVQEETDQDYEVSQTEEQPPLPSSKRTVEDELDDILGDEDEEPQEIELQTEATEADPPPKPKTKTVPKKSFRKMF